MLHDKRPRQPGSGVSRLGNWKILEPDLAQLQMAEGCAVLAGSSASITHAAFCSCGILPIVGTDLVLSWAQPTLNKVFCCLLEMAMPPLQELGCDCAAHQLQQDGRRCAEGDPR